MDTERDCAPGAACSTRSNHISRALLHITHPTAPSYVRSRGPNQYLTNDIPSTTFGIEAPPCACEGYRPLAAPSSRRNSSTAHRSSLRRSLVQDQTPANGRTPPHPRMPRSQDRVTATAPRGTLPHGPVRLAHAPSAPPLAADPRPRRPPRYEPSVGMPKLSTLQWAGQRSSARCAQRCGGVVRAPWAPGARACAWGARRGSARRGSRGGVGARERKSYAHVAVGAPLVAAGLPLGLAVVECSEPQLRRDVVIFRLLRKRTHAASRLASHRPQRAP